RHTRFSRDWSSDVCSSDLLDGLEADGEIAEVGAGRDQEVLDQFCQLAALPGDDCHHLADLFLAELVGPVDDRLGETDDRCEWGPDRKSTRLNSSHVKISYA